MNSTAETPVDVVIVGAGAAGLMTAIWAARTGPGRRVLLLDGARTLGAKILVAGGGRCNVTNERVTVDDYRGGNKHLLRRVLAALPVDRTIAFFRELGVPLHREPYGKLFPNTNKARTVLDALLREAERLGVMIHAGRRVRAVARLCGDSHDRPVGFVCQTDDGPVAARRLVLATGGLSLPKTGSDGAGYALAKALGHSVTPTTPALEPLILSGGFHAPLSGVALDAALRVCVADARPVEFRGPLLWTHFGVSGPIALNASGYWRRARLEQRRVTIEANLLALPDEAATVAAPRTSPPTGERIVMPPEIDVAPPPATLSTLDDANDPRRALSIAARSDAAALEAALVERARLRPRGTLRAMLAEWLPARLAEAVLTELAIEPALGLAHLARDSRRRLAAALLGWPLPVCDGRGYGYAEVTAGGVPLEELDVKTMESRVCPGLHLVGEITDVDGRIGGFNFQWAWSSGFVAGSAIGSAAPETH